MGWKEDIKYQDVFDGPVFSKKLEKVYQNSHNNLFF